MEESPHCGGYRRRMLTCRRPVGGRVCVLTAAGYRRRMLTCRRPVGGRVCVLTAAGIAAEC